ncbi:MAG: hypothetical protein RBT74_03735 [Tenuifilaceae bacterium]|jgi:hypothetical protein|nr:hypothetical protein [Tenuifilaceae bacterium]
MSVELILIVILIAYIVLLQIQLYKRDKRIESLIKQQINFKDLTSHEEIELLISRLKTFPHDSIIKPNKLFEPEVQDFLFRDVESNVLFAHYTKTQDVAEIICREGFRFAESFYKTAEPIINDKLDLGYKHNLRKQYGNFIVVISISKHIYDKYTHAIEQVNAILNVEQILSTLQPQLNENQDEVYLLPPQFIKGFINVETGEVVPNLNYKSTYDSPVFATNIKTNSSIH